MSVVAKTAVACANMSTFTSEIARKTTTPRVTIKLLGPVEASVMRIYMIVRIDEIVRLATGEMKTTKRLRLQAYPCRVCLQNCAFGEASICCDGCQSWIHSACINMTDAILRDFSAEERTFLCQSCACSREDNRYSRGLINDS